MHTYAVHAFLKAFFRILKLKLFILNVLYNSSVYVTLRRVQPLNVCLDSYDGLAFQKSYRILR